MRAATSGPCTPSITPARTVISSSLLRRHRIGSSSSKRSVASWASETTPPLPVRRLIASRPSTLSRSAGTARATTSIVSVRSRYCVTVTPDSSVCSVLPRSCEVDAERARLVLVDLEPHRLGELVPVEVDVARGGIGLEHLADLLGDGADLLRIVAQHAEHHRVADRRAVLQALHAGAHRLEAVARTAGSRSATTRSRAARSLVMTMTWPKFALESSGTVGR